MKTHILKDSKQQIAEKLVSIPEEVREAIMFVEEPTIPKSIEQMQVPVDVFAEMLAFMVQVNEVDDSREAVYSRLEGEMHHWACEK
jgi:hypothetical protein